MMEKNWDLIRKFTACLCLALHPSCSEGPADATKDRYRQIADITRDEAALKNT